MDTRSKSESGQIVVILAIAIVALFGFAALAIDVGMVYSDRRYDQSVADASALAGAQAAAQYIADHSLVGTAFNCAAAIKTAALTAAQYRSDQNHFTIIDISAASPQPDMGFIYTCVNSPITGSGGTVVAYDRHVTIKVLISSNTGTTFAHLIFSGLLRNTVTAEIYLEPRDSGSAGYAIIGLRDVCPNNENNASINFNGGVNAVITGGGVYSNGCLNLSGNSTVINVTGGSIDYNMALKDPNSRSPYITPPPVDTNTILTIDQIDPPDCNDSSMVDRTIPNGNNYVLSPGRYNSPLNVRNGDTVFLNPGLYCFTRDITVSGILKLNSSDPLDGVTIYMQPSTDTNKTSLFTVGGGADLELRAPSPNPATPYVHHNYPALNGLLIFVDKENQCRLDNDTTGVSTKCVSITGNGQTNIHGTIYSPTGAVFLGGTSGVTTNYGVNVIAYVAIVDGNTTINIAYDYNHTYQAPTHYSLSK